MLVANLLDANNYRGQDLEKLNRSLKLLEVTLNSSDFENRVKNFEAFVYRRYKCVKKFGITIKWKTIWPEEHKGYTNVKLFDHLMSGQRSENGNTYMDLKLQLGTGDGVGSTNMSTKVITTNRWAFDSKSDEEIAGHIAHEYMHTLGFKHTHQRCDPERDCFSVPYAIGNLVELVLTGNDSHGCKKKYE